MTHAKRLKKIHFRREMNTHITHNQNLNNKKVFTGYFIRTKLFFVVISRLNYSKYFLKSFWS